MSNGIAIIYDRASTQKQSENYTRQDVKRIGTEIARRYGYEVEAEPRFEIKSGEELRNRAVMLGILKDIQASKAKAIIVPNFTRLSRDEDIIDGLVIKKICRENGVVIIDFNGKVYNFENDNDQDAAFLELWFGARDKRQIVGNMMRGAKERARQGKYMGGFAPLGYKLELSGEVNKRGKPLYKRAIMPEEAKIVRMIFRLYQSNSATECARILNIKGILLPIKSKPRAKDSKATTRPFTGEDIMRVVRNALYAGWMRWNMELSHGRPRSKYLRDFEPQMHFDLSLQIISQSEFDRVQRIIKERCDVPSRSAVGNYPFSRLLKCKNCGGVMTANVAYRNGVLKYDEHRYRCGTHFDDPKTCPNGQSLAAIPIANAVIPMTAKLLHAGLQLTSALKQAAQEYAKNDTMKSLEAETRAQLESTNQATARLMDAIANGLVFADEAKAKIEELRDKKERLTRDLQRFNESENIRAEILEAIQYVNGDLEKVLWGLFDTNPRILARILRLIFKPHSFVIETFWGGNGRGRRGGRVIEYALNEEFQEFVDSKHSDVLQTAPRRRA